MKQSLHTPSTKALLCFIAHNESHNKDAMLFREAGNLEKNQHNFEPKLTDAIGFHKSKEHYWGE